MKIRRRLRKKRMFGMFLVAFLMIHAVIVNFAIMIRAEQEADIAVTEIDMGEYSDTMTVGDKQLLTVTVLPVEVGVKTVTYASSNTAVATINGMGRITALAVGTANITATCQKKSASFTLTVKEKSESNIPVKELDLGEYQSKMEIGTSQLLSVTPLPTDATNTKITYASSDTSVATVNSMGRISALGIGNTTITIQCDGVTASIKIAVVKKKDEKIEVSDIEIANHQDKVKVDETISLSATVLPKDATNSTVCYQSSDENIATVNSSGEVKGIRAGTVTITIKAGKITKKEKIKVMVPTKAITMNNDYLVLKPGDIFKLSGVVFPSEAPQILSYKSTNSKIATVSQGGLVTAKTLGNTSIIVSNGDYQIGVSVIVNKLDQSVENDKNNKNKTDNVKEPTVTYENTINASKVKKIDTDMLKYLYENKIRMLINGNGYSISIDGENIVNDRNAFVTDIDLSYDNSKGKEKISFVINNGNPLCGDITLCLDNVKGRYLYLYNETKEQYEIIATANLEKIVISTPGKYLIINSPIRRDNGVILIISIVGGAALLVGIGVYIWCKKRYWFW